MSDLPSNIAWLADAPLFIDANQISRFYDAIVKPETEKGQTTPLTGNYSPIPTFLRIPSI